MTIFPGNFLASDYYYRDPLFPESVTHLTGLGGGYLLPGQDPNVLFPGFPGLAAFFNLAVAELDSDPLTANWTMVAAEIALNVAVDANTLDVIPGGLEAISSAGFFSMNPGAAPIPVPAALPLFLSGLLGLAFIRRKPAHDYLNVPSSRSRLSMRFRFSRPTRIASVFAAMILFGGLSTPERAEAAVIHESASFGGNVPTASAVVSNIQFLGSRFSTTVPVQVTEVGGNIGSGGEIFAAIVALPSPTGLPSFAPTEIENNALAGTIFDAGSASTDVLTPLAVFLPPGDYALVFGSGAYGATGSECMQDVNTDLPGASRFFGDKNQGDIWINTALTNRRFVVQGSIVPIPAALPLFASALSIIGFRWHKVN